MAIALRAAGAWAAGSTAPAPTIPTGTTTGDLMLLYVGCKPFSATINTPSGWTLIPGTDGQNGTVANGVDVGSVRWAIFYRLWLSGDANPTISVTSGNVSLAVIKSFSKALSNWVTPAGGKGSDNTSDPNLFIQTDASPGMAIVNDMLVTFTTIAGNNATFGSPTISSADLVTDTVIESPATEGTTATGNDLESSSSHALVVSSVETDVPAIGWTLSAAQTGGGAFARLRESAGTVFNQSVAGSLTFVTALVKRDAKVFAGGLTFFGAMTKQLARTLQGGLIFAGTFATVILKTIAFTAAVSFSGAVSKQAGKTVASALAFVGRFCKRSSYWLGGRSCLRPPTGAHSPST